MGLHEPMGGPILAEVEAIPFARAIRRIEEVRGEIDSVRSSNLDSEALEKKLVHLEHALQKAYANLASQAAAKLAKWEDGPILKRSRAAREKRSR